MKTSNFFFGLLLLAAASLFQSCDPNGKTDENAAGNDSSATEAPAKPLTAEEQKQEDVFTQYIALKDAFVASDTAAARSAALKMKAALQDMPVADSAAWAQPKQLLQAQLDSITLAPDLNTQRVTFSHLSDNYYTLAKTHNLIHTSAYHTYCPMAFDKGAYWISDKAEIKNPYFGQSMLECGEVQDTLK